MFCFSCPGVFFEAVSRSWIKAFLFDFSTPAAGAVPQSVKRPGLRSLKKRCDWTGVSSIPDRSILVRKNPSCAIYEANVGVCVRFGKVDVDKKFTLVWINRDRLLHVPRLVEDVDDGPGQRINDHFRPKAPQLPVQLLVIGKPEAPLPIHRVIPDVFKYKAISRLSSVKSSWRKN